MFQYFKFLADFIHVHILFSVAAGLPLEPPRLIVDRIRRDGRAPPVCSFRGVSVRCLPRPVAGFTKLLRHCSQFLKPFASFRILSTPLKFLRVKKNKSSLNFQRTLLFSGSTGFEPVE